MSQRLDHLHRWLAATLQSDAYTIAPASSDASFRRYFRVTLDTQACNKNPFADFLSGNTLIAMDAPPDKENSHPFVKIAKWLAHVGVNVPQVLSSDLMQGFLLLTDLGSTQYLSHINKTNVDHLYADAIETLLLIQGADVEKDIDLPNYDQELLQRELNIFTEWFLQAKLEHSLTASQHAVLQDGFNLLINSALEQPTCLVHRDYHSRNLMYVERGNPGVLDFQDAVVGPVSYDIVSLLRDCYIQWPSEQVQRWSLEFYQRKIKSGQLQNTTEEQWVKWFDLMGMQRHLKAIGIFSRLSIRDSKSGYLNDIPRTLSYVQLVCDRYTELNEFKQLINLLT